MRKTIVGLFDHISEAQAAVRELIDSGFRRDDISLIAGERSGTYTKSDADVSDTTSGAAVGAGAGAVLGGLGGLVVGLGALAIPGIGPVIAAGPLASTLLGAGVGAAAGGLIGALVDVGVPEEEAGSYAEGIRRGATLVAVKTDDEMMVDRAVNILERHNAVDIERRAGEWRSAGWTGFNPQSEPYTQAPHAREEPTPRAAATQARAATRGETGETKIPVVEEELRVGKRTVERGGVRVFSRVVERPVEEQVKLRDERITVDRRPVDRAASSADAGAFKEEVIELHETDEEAVVSKQARVKEEVVVSKDVEERTETVRDKARRTEVEVEQMGTAEGARPATYDTYAADFRNNFTATYGNRGRTYDYYEPAYRYGCTIAADKRYAGKDWSAVEADVRREWEKDNRGAWEEFKDSVRYAWDRARGRTPARAA